MTPKVLLFGVGGVGSVYAYIIDKGGADVTCVCRSNYEAVSENGFSISSEIFGNVKVKSKVVRSVSEVAGQAFDYIVICSKVTVGKTPSTADVIRPAVIPSTTIVLAQNGIGIEDDYVSAFPNNVIISGSVYLPATQISPGVVEMQNLELLEIGTFPSTAPRNAKEAVTRFADIFTKGGATCKVFEDIQFQRWKKLLVNAPLNPTCALTLLSDADFIRSSPKSEAHLRNVMLEVLSVAHAKGYTGLTKADIDWHLERSTKRLNTRGKDPSMLTDVRMGRALEVEAILGNLLRIAQDVGVSVPRCETLYALASGMSYALEKGQRIGPAP